MKDNGLKIKSLPIKYGCSYKNVLQNGVISLSKMVLKNLSFCPKAQNFGNFGLYDLVKISPVCSPNTFQIMYREILEFYVVSAFATVARKKF